MRVSHYFHIGQREENQDRCAVFWSDDGNDCLMLVADGAGYLQSPENSPPVPLQRSLLASPEGLVIGRSAEICHVALLHGSVSRRHARLRLDAYGALVVEDLGSTGGTTVNGARLAPFTPSPLPNGAALAIAGLTFGVRL